MIEFKRIKLDLLDTNVGQIPGLPANPRQWSDAEVRRLAKSMKKTPQLAEARGCIVAPHEGRYVIIGGNLRREAAESLGWPDIMCAVLPEDTPVARLKEVVLKDNSSFGSWDLEALRSDWVEGIDWGGGQPRGLGNRCDMGHRRTGSDKERDGRRDHRTHEARIRGAHGCRRNLGGG